MSRESSYSLIFSKTNTQLNRQTTGLKFRNFFCFTLKFRKQKNSLFNLAKILEGK